MAGRIAWIAPSRVARSKKNCGARAGCGAHANTASTSGTTRRGSATARVSCASNPSAGRWVCDAGHRCAENALPQQASTAAANRARCWPDQVRGRRYSAGRVREAFRLRPSSPSGCLATFDVAMSCTLHRTLRALAVFRHRRVLSRVASTARRDSPDEFFIPTFRYRRSPFLTERACGRHPCRCGFPCVQLVASLLSGQATRPGRK